MKLHPRSKHQDRYDLVALINTSPELGQFVVKNKHGNYSIDFFNADAVKTLNRALLKYHYNIVYWDIPANYLCPPIPGRADYIHYIADVLAQCNDNKIPNGASIKCLDIGVGANCVYPIIGSSEYGWSFIGTDIESNALTSAKNIVKSNPNLNDMVELRLQSNPSNIFSGIISKEEKMDLSICNPPFHSSAEEANKGSFRKLRNLKRKQITKTDLNFGGKSNELWTTGGEKRFILDMIKESKEFKKSCFWFSTLVSKKDNLESIYKQFDRAKVSKYKTVSMGQGNKISRLVAWTFLSKTEMETWTKERWA